MKSKSLICVVLTIVCATGNWCHAELISNGSFESPSFTLGAGATVNPGSEPAGFAWTVSSGNVDIAHFPFPPFVQFPAIAGDQALDLNGTVRGAIYQEFATNPGQQYQLSFAFADNPFEGGESTADVNVTDAGSMSSLLASSISHSTSTNQFAGADWFLFSDMFTATGATTRLAFGSTSPSNSPSGGIILDAVSVTAVPEPASLALLGVVSMTALSLRSRRR